MAVILSLTEFVPGRFQLVLTDIGMPGVTGWHVAEVVRMLDTHVTLGFVTGWSDDVTLEKLEDARVDMVIPKPFTIEHVQGVIDQAIARSLEPPVAPGPSEG